MRKYSVKFIDKGSQKTDEVFGWSNNEAAQRVRERYGHHVVVLSINEISS